MVIYERLGETGARLRDDGASPDRRTTIDLGDLTVIWDAGMNGVVEVLVPDIDADDLIRLLSKVADHGGRWLAVLNRDLHPDDTAHARLVTDRHARLSDWFNADALQAFALLGG